MRYVLQFVHLPRAICNVVDKECINYMWRDSENNMKFILFLGMSCVFLKASVLSSLEWCDTSKTLLWSRHDVTSAQILMLFGLEPFVININVVHLIYPKFLWLNEDQIYGKCLC